MSVRLLAYALLTHLRALVFFFFPIALLSLAHNANCLLTCIWHLHESTQRKKPQRIQTHYRVILYHPLDCLGYRDLEVRSSTAEQGITWELFRGISPFTLGLICVAAQWLKNDVLLEQVNGQVSFHHL